MKDHSPTERPIRVVHLITSLNVGGAENYLVRLLERPDPRIEPTVICLMDGAPHLIERIRNAGIPLTVLGIIHWWDGIWALVRLFRLIRRSRPDVLVSWLYHSDLAALLLRRLCAIPTLIWNVRCSDLDTNYHSRLTAMIRWILSRYAHAPDAVICNSHAGLQAHFDLGYRAQRWRVLPNGFDVDRFRPDADRRLAFRESLGIADTDVLVGLVGRLDPMKDHETFLAAAQRLAAQRSAVQFVMVGDGTEPENHALTATIQATGYASRFHLLGRRMDLETIYPGIDILVSSSAFGEGLPNVVGEAMACGVPCVVTDTGDGPKLVADRSRIIPPRNPESLADAVSRLIDLPPGKREEIGLAGRQRIARDYHLDDAWQRFTDTIVELHDLQSRSRKGPGERPIRLLLTCNHMAAGGTEAQIYELLSRLDARAYERTLLLVHASRYQVFDLLERGVTVEMPRRRTRWPMLETIIAPARFILLQWRRRFDIAHFFLPESYIVYGLPALLAGPKRRIMSRRSLNIYQQAHPVAAVVEHMLHRYMSVLTGNSRAVVHEVQRELPDKQGTRVALIYNGIAIPEPAPEAAKVALRQCLGATPETLIFVIVANLFHYKGHLDLIEALGRVASDLPADWMLLSIGHDNGGLAAARKCAEARGIADKIQWAGHRNRAEVLELLTVCDIAVLPSHQEGFPNALLEAMAVGIPPVATRVGGIPEIITGPELGLLVPPHDPTALGEALLALACDPARRAAIGEAARRSVAERFSHDQMVARHDRLYRAVLPGPVSDAQSAIDPPKHVGEGVLS